MSERIRIAYERDGDDSTYIVVVPLEPGQWPKALRGAIDVAGRLLVGSLARDLTTDVVPGSLEVTIAPRV